MVSKKATIIGGATLLVVAVVASVAAIIVHNAHPKTNPNSDNFPNISLKAIQDLCQNTYYQQTCMSSLTRAPNSSDPRTLIKTSFTIAIERLGYAINQTIPLEKATKDPRMVEAYQYCRVLLDDSIDDLQRTFDRFDAFDIADLDKFADDLQTWLTGASTFQETCRDTIEEAQPGASIQMRELMKEGHELTINGQALIKEFTKSLESSGNNIAPGRRLMAKNNPGVNVWYREPHIRHILDGTPKTINPNVTVAKDGTGKYKTINEALKDVPLKSNRTFIIYIKEGLYIENVTITKDMKNVVLIGDGPTRTTISESKSYLRGIKTNETGTVFVAGDHFIAKDIRFENTAGPEEHQAVALRVVADESLFHNCQIDGYQDTLYVHAHRQLYTKCSISGTIDFVFGNARAVLEDCLLVVRKPLDNQYCMVTAGGREYDNETSAIVLNQCDIQAASDYPFFNKNIKTYLGRPWKPFARAIIMNSRLGSLIDPAGWSPWNNTNAHLDTSYLAELNNTGPGADLSRRATWPGVQKNFTLEQADKYRTRKFIRYPAPPPPPKQ